MRENSRQGKRRTTSDAQTQSHERSHVPSHVPSETRSQARSQAPSTSGPRTTVPTREAPVRSGPASGSRAPGAPAGGRAPVPDGIVETRTAPVPSVPRPGEPRPRVSRAAAAAAGSGVAYHGGPLIAHVEVTAFYWGSAWSDPGLSALASQLNRFFADFTAGLPNIGSPLDQLAEYSQGSYVIGRGSFRAPGRFVTPAITPDPGATVDDSAIQKLLPQLLAAFAITPDSGSLFVLFTPPNVTVTMGSSASCKQFCGYHGNAGGIHYAVMPYPCAQGCTGSMSIFDALTVTVSHEICEAVTDPEFNGWWDSTTTGNEIGDFCAWTPKHFGPYMIQEEWSNAAGSCV